jgi:hypothetical protein
MAEVSEIPFVTRCPEGHDVAVMFAREDLSFALAVPTSRYWCSVCQRFWTMTDDERERLRLALRTSR